jgi:hypothetical protein
LFVTIVDFAIYWWESRAKPAGAVLRDMDVKAGFRQVRALV